MPGIAGIIAKNKSDHHDNKIDTMVKCMLHESFYTHGIYKDKEKGIYIGYVSIKDSFSDCMPIYNEKQNILLFITGECYVDDDLLLNLKKKGHLFNKENAEFLVHLYEEEQEHFFKNLNGWFNGILLDLTQNKTILFNDRCGLRRIYYYEDKDALYFSSEAKSLLQIHPHLKKLDFESVGEFLVYDSILQNRTYFSNIFLLPANSKWIFSKNKIIKDTCIDYSALENQAPLPIEQYLDELKHTFIKILPRYFRGKKIGMSLTGGLDTRLILACLDLKAGELPCFTFGGKYRDIIDIRIAPKVAQVCHQEHHRLLLDDEEYLNSYPDLVNESIYITDGIQKVEQTDMIYFNKLARQVAPIRMTGKYGSQVLKHVFGFKERPPYEELIKPEFLIYTNKARETGTKLSNIHNFSFLLQNEIPWWWNGILCAESSQVDVRSPYLDNDLIALMYRAPELNKKTAENLQMNMIKELNPALGRLGTTSSSHLKILLNIDKMNIRERLPFSLTHIVGKVDRILHPLHINRLYTGFADFRRYRAWYRDQLSQYLIDTLLCERTYSRPYWNKEYLDKFVNGHIAGKGTYLREIRKVLQVELIHRVLLEDNYNISR